MYFNLKISSSCFVPDAILSFVSKVHFLNLCWWPEKKTKVNQNDLFFWYFCISWQNTILLYVRTKYDKICQDKIRYFCMSWQNTGALSSAKVFYSPCMQVLYKSIGVRYLWMIHDSFHTVYERHTLYTVCIRIRYRSILYSMHFACAYILYIKDLI